MLRSSRMNKHVCRLAALGGLAFLILIPAPHRSDAAGLREEAVTYRVQGYELQQRGDKVAALSLYQKASALDPSYPAPHNDMGVLYEEQGRLDEAEHAYRNALAINPNYLEAHANLAMLYERKGDKEKAIYHWLKRYQLGDPYDPWTARAEERLVALGMLKTYPGLKGSLFTRRRVVAQELESHARSLEEFHALTEEHADWP